MYNQSGNENKENNHLGDNVLMSIKFYYSIDIEKAGESSENTTKLS